eukprot:115896_1
MAQHLATTKCNRDVDSDDDTLHLRICINKQYFLTENIDPRQDVWKSGELDETSLNMEDLRDEIPLTFRAKKLFKRLFADRNQWQWTVYEYHATEASVSIQKSHDLQTYADASLSSISDEGDEKYLKLRIVFHRSEAIESKSVSLTPNNPTQQLVNHDVSNIIPCDTCGDNKDHHFAHDVGSYVAPSPEHSTQVLDGQKTDTKKDTSDDKIHSNETPTSNDIPCELCGKHIPFVDYQEHQLQHLLSIKTESSPHETHISNYIPCELCGEHLPFLEYLEHQSQHLLSITTEPQLEQTTTQIKVNDDIHHEPSSVADGDEHKETIPCESNCEMPKKQSLEITAYVDDHKEHDVVPTITDDTDHKEDDSVAIPTEFKDPITNKIMQSPTMIVSSSQVYDEITIKEMIKSQRTHDVITGVPFSIGGWPLLLEYRMDIQSKIDEFLKENALNKAQVMNKSDANAFPWELLFEKHEHKIEEEVAEIVQDQSALQHSAKQIFKPLNEQKDEKEEKQPPPNDKKKELLQKAHQLYYKVTIKNRRFFFTKHENCFVGSEAVSAIMDLGFA